MRTFLGILLAVFLVVAIWYLLSKQAITLPSIGDIDMIGENETVDVDHSNEGFLLVPVDSNGNVVPKQTATQYMKLTRMVECGYNRNIIIRVRPKPTEEV